MAVPDEPSHPGVAGASLSSEVQHCYQRPSHFPPPPSALMPFAQEKRRSVAAMNAKENNQRISSRLAKLRCPLRAADKETLQRKVAEVVAVHRRMYPDYTHHPREAHRRKEQRERIVKQVTSKLKNDSSWNKEQQPTTCTVAARGRGGLKFQQQLHPPPMPPPPRSTHSAVSGAARVSASGSGQGTVACMPTATVPATTKDPEEQMVPVKVTALRAFAEFSKRQSKHFHNYAELTLINIFRTLKQPERQRRKGVRWPPRTRTKTTGALCSRLAKLWLPLRAADKEPFQRKVAEAVTSHRSKYSDYAHNPREASRCMEQERIAKQVTSKLKNGSSWDKEQQPRTSTVAAHGRGSPEFQQQLHPPPLPPTPRSKHRGTINASPDGASGAGQKTVACMPTAPVPATTKDLEGHVVPVKAAALRPLAELLKR
ncbi:hypothetical protein HPB49_013046 [Dermacentor silvarum]|uniref:Uncharacterized protein n=1 Tax=Dermacentor silvarum TaxID=543639 RepID=A0ACB8E0H7_DERSI|nr:hypothetical protein HPB49_013046 [Dermacentor silvarum]